MSYPSPYDRERAIYRARYDDGAMSYAEYLAALDAIDQEEDADIQEAQRLTAERDEAERLWAEEDDET